MGTVLRPASVIDQRFKSRAVFWRLTPSPQLSVVARREAIGRQNVGGDVPIESHETQPMAFAGIEASREKYNRMEPRAPPRSVETSNDVANTDPGWHQRKRHSRLRVATRESEKSGFKGTNKKEISKTTTISGTRLKYGINRARNWLFSWVSLRYDGVFESFNRMRTQSFQARIFSGLAFVFFASLSALYHVLSIYRLPRVNKTRSEGTLRRRQRPPPNRSARCEARDAPV